LQKKLINIYSILKKMAKSSVSVVLVLFIVVMIMNTLAANANGTELNKNGAGVGNEKTLGWILYCNELYQKCLLDPSSCPHYYAICLFKNQSPPAPPPSSQG
jgi:hypothetical protein